jgi:quercetin dioxygenase-like cupin family protein
MKPWFVAMVAGIAIGIFAVHTSRAQTAPSPVQPPPVKRTIVGKADVPGSNYEVITGIVEIQPGFKAGRHFHPGVVHGHVLEGEFWVAIDGQPEKTLAAGETLILSDRAIHNEGATAKGAKVIATYVVEKGQPLVQPAQ